MEGKNTTAFDIISIKNTILAFLLFYSLIPQALQAPVAQCFYKRLQCNSKPHEDSVKFSH